MDERSDTDDDTSCSPPRGDALPVGNKRFEEMLIREGKLGMWYPRANASNPNVWAEIVPEVFRRSVHATTAGVLRLLATNASGGVGSSQQEDADDRKIDAAARSIADAVCLMAYLKIRAVNLAMGGLRDDSRYYARPHALPRSPLEIPLPFAAAISRLGAVEVRSLTRRMVAAPAVPAGAAASFLLPPGRCSAFDGDAYARAAAFARSLGVQFAAVDVDAGPWTGTAWWLLQGSVDAGSGAFSLRCVVPESNYAVEDALVHSMFCLDERLGFGAELFRLQDQVARGDYGPMLRNPHAGLNVNSFLAFSDEPLRSMWKM